jgi:dihydroorotate dehydrogenase
MAKIDLSVNIGGFLDLAEPLWIASAHYSTSKQSVSAWKREGIVPAAFTLKTSKRLVEAEEKKTVRYPTNPSLPRFGRSFYCDGPKQLEFLTYEATADLLKHAQAELPETKVGTSILSDAAENYAELAAMCADAEFCELNLKYGFRSKAGAPDHVIDAAKQRFEAILAEVGKFTEAFAGKPIFVKLPREMAWLAGSVELATLLDALHAHGKAGLIVANSRRMNVPEFIADGAEWRLENGVMCGEHLLDETINLIGALRTACDERRIPMIATGGMIDPEHVLTALRGGAAAVQLCTAFVYNNRGYYNTLTSKTGSKCRA